MNNAAHSQVAALRMAPAAALYPIHVLVCAFYSNFNDTANAELYVVRKPCENCSYCTLSASLLMRHTRVLYFEMFFFPHTLSHVKYVFPLPCSPDGQYAGENALHFPTRFCYLIRAN